MNRALATLALALSLAACHDKQADTGKAAAAAEVLPGSASDAMIAYDTLKSQPPMAVATGSDEGPGSGTRRRNAGTDASDAAAAASDVSPEGPGGQPADAPTTTP